VSKNHAHPDSRHTWLHIKR